MKKALTFVLMLTAAMSVLSLPAFAGVAMWNNVHVPEPGSMLLLASGLGGAAMIRRLRNK
ncbi:MAG TPA: PEP-CTERM sorting domain-containing protein [Candidatus Dormibacteraeota bacterium]|nr:PEP-CTERM sorting domain-containing protein [Candidatus Dormibacteraeota bacterium]